MGGEKRDWEYEDERIAGSQGNRDINAETHKQGKCQGKWKTTKWKKWKRKGEEKEEVGKERKHELVEKREEEKERKRKKTKRGGRIRKKQMKKEEGEGIGGHEQAAMYFHRNQPKSSVGVGFDAPNIDSLPLADIKENPLQLLQLVGPVRFHLMAGLEEIHFHHFPKEAQLRKRGNGGETTKGEVEVEHELGR